MSFRKLREQTEQESREIQRLLEERQRRTHQELLKGPAVASSGSAWAKSSSQSTNSVTTTGKASSKEDTRSLKEIQMEEERQMAAERRQQLEHESMHAKV